MWPPASASKPDDCDGRQQQHHWSCLRYGRRRSNDDAGLIVGDGASKQRQARYRIVQLCPPETLNVFSKVAEGSHSQVKIAVV
jgi:hypothetical protein